MSSARPNAGVDCDNQSGESLPLVGRFIRRRRAVCLLSILLVVGVASALGSEIWLRWQIHLGRGALTRAQPEEALVPLHAAVRFAPNNAQANYLLAVAERRSGRLDRVSVPLQRAATLAWPKADIDRQSLLMIAQSGDVDRVHASLKAIIARGVDDEAAEEIYEALAIGFLKTYRLKEAWECLTYWSAWQPSAVFPRIWRADICRRVNNRAGEERECRAILAIAPTHCDARRRLAEVLKDSNRLDEAKGEFEKCLATCSESAAVLVGLAECYRRLAMSRSASSLLERALILNPTPLERATTLSELGQIATDEGRTQDAIHKLQEAVDLAPYQAPIVYALAQAYARTGDTDRSSELIRQSSRIRAQSDRIDELMQQLLTAPNNADQRFEVGAIMMDLGLKEEGAMWLRTAIQADPNHQLAQERLSAYEAEKKSATPNTPSETDDWGR